MSQQYSQQIPPGGQDGYGQAVPPGQSYENYETQSPPGVPPGPPTGPPAAGGRKKRAYAGQAYEFGAGANAGLGGQQTGGGAPAAPYSGYSAQQDAAGYPQGGYQQNPAAVQQGQTPMYGQQDAGAPGGYQPPQPAYPTQPQGGVPGMTQQFGQMNMNQPPPPQQQVKAPQLNQLYPADLSNSPFNVAELDYLPPPAVLPPNVSARRRSQTPPS